MVCISLIFILIIFFNSTALMMNNYHHTLTSLPLNVAIISAIIKKSVLYR